MSSTTENAAVLIIESTTPVRQDWTGSGWPITSQSNMTPWLQLQPLTCSKQREVLCLLQSGAEFCWISFGSCVILWIRPRFILQTADKCTITSVFHEALYLFTSLGQDRMGLWYIFLLKSVGSVNSSMTNVFRMSLHGLILKLLSLCISAFKRIISATFGANILFIS